MINLIPNEEKKRKVQDFYFRLAVVFLMVLAFSTLIASASLLPSYFISNVKKNFFNSKLEAQRNEPLPPDDQKTLSVVSELENKLSVVENFEKNKYLVSEKIIGEIISRKMEDIKITQVFYTSALDQSKKVTITGSAPSRERLLVFRKALEESRSFKKVDLPISNFIKGTDINFTFNLIPS